MPRGRKPKINPDIIRQQEALNSPVRSDGAGEDAPVKTLLSNEFLTMPDSEALNVALALQQIIKGQNSLLANVSQFGEELAKLRERMDRYDRAAQAWETDRAKFLEKINERAEALRIDDPDKKAQFRAKAIQNIQNEITRARAEQQVANLEFEHLLKTQPKEEITSPGKVITVNRAGTITTEVIPETIRIRDKVWVLPPNTPVLVPKLVADEWRIRHVTLMEQEERKKLLQPDNNGMFKDTNTVAKVWKDISNKYKSNTEDMPEG